MEYVVRLLNENVIFYNVSIQCHTPQNKPKKNESVKISGFSIFATFIFMAMIDCYFFRSLLKVQEHSGTLEIHSVSEKKEDFGTHRMINFLFLCQAAIIENEGGYIPTDRCIYKNNIKAKIIILF